MTSYTTWPPLFGTVLIQQDEQSPDNFYVIPRSQTLVFPFSVSEYHALRVDAGHTTFYDNQQGTIRGWASREINGRDISMDSAPGRSSIQLQGDGFHWLFYDLALDPQSILDPPGQPPPSQRQWINPNQTYFMCFQNLENKDNGLFMRFTVLTP